MWQEGRGRAESAVEEWAWRLAVIRWPSEWWVTPVFNSSDWWWDGYSSPFTCEGESDFETQKAGLRDCVRQGASQEFVLNFILVKKHNKSPPHNKIAHSWSLTSSSSFNTSWVTLVPNPGTRKSSRHYAAASWIKAVCGGGKIPYRSPPLATWGADGPQEGTGGPVLPFGSSTGGSPAGHPELAGPGGPAGHSPSYRPCTTGEDGSTGWPRRDCGPLRKDSGCMWVGSRSVAGALDPAAVRGGAGGSTTATCGETSGLCRSEAGYSSASRVLCPPRAVLTVFPLCGSGGQRLAVHIGPKASRRLPPVADGRDTWRWGCGRCDGAGAVRCETAEWVQFHHLTLLDQTIQLAEDHLVACPGVGVPPSNLSLSLSLSLSPNLPPLFSDLLLGHGAVPPLEPHSVERWSWGTDRYHEGAWWRLLVQSHHLHLPPLSTNLLALLPLGWGERLDRPAGGAGIWRISRIGVL